MYLLNRMQPGGLNCLWCIIFNTTLNLMLFTGVLALIKDSCVSMWCGVIYSASFAVILR